MIFILAAIAFSIPGVQWLAFTVLNHFNLMYSVQRMVYPRW